MILVVFSHQPLRRRQKSREYKRKFILDIKTKAHTDWLTDARGTNSNITRVELLIQEFRLCHLVIRFRWHWEQPVLRILCLPVGLFQMFILLRNIKYYNGVFNFHIACVNLLIQEFGLRRIISRPGFERNPKNLNLDPFPPHQIVSHVCIQRSKQRNV